MKQGRWHSTEKANPRGRDFRTSPSPWVTSLSGLAPSSWSLCRSTARGVIENQTGDRLYLLPTCTSVQMVQSGGRQSHLWRSRGPLHLILAPSPTPLEDSASPYLAHIVCTPFSSTSAITGSPSQPINISLSFVGSREGGWKVDYFFLPQSKHLKV